MITAKIDRLIIFSVHIPSHTIIKVVERTKFKRTMTVKKLLNCSPSENCLGVLTVCSSEKKLCLFVIPPLQMIITMNKKYFTKFSDVNLHIEKPLKVQLFPDLKKLFIMHNYDEVTKSVDVIIYNFKKQKSGKILQQQVIFLSKNKRTLSPSEVFLMDRVSLASNLEIFDVFVFRRFHAFRVCVVYFNKKLVCYSVLESGQDFLLSNPLLTHEQTFHLINEMKLFFKKNLVLLLFVNGFIFLLIWCKTLRVNYRDHVFQRQIVV